MDKKDKMSVLYLSYNGLMEPLGQSQVFQYLQKLSKDHKITLVTYEKKQDWQNKPCREAVLQAVQETGMRWIPLCYHKRPATISTAWDLAIGFIVCIYLCIRYRVRIVHARGYVVSVLGLELKRILGVQFIFDMRSFHPDDILELGIWNKESLIYRIAKWFERRFLLEADVVVALTQKAIEAMRKYPYLQGKSKRFEVITTCTNLDLFKPVLYRENCGTEIDGRPFILGYVGTVGPYYEFDPVLECFKVLKRRLSNAHLLIINRNDHSYIFEHLKACGINMDSVEVKEVNYEDVPREIGRMNAGVFFYTPTNSQISRSPTKMGELLACGVPCLANAGVGNVKEILENDRVGVVLHEFNQQSMEKAVEQLLELAGDPEIQTRCISVAQRHFSLESGVRAYDRIYRELGDRSS